MPRTRTRSETAAPLTRTVRSRAGPSAPILPASSAGERDEKSERQCRRASAPAGTPRSVGLRKLVPDPTTVALRRRTG